MRTIRRMLPGFLIRKSKERVSFAGENYVPNDAMLASEIFSFVLSLCNNLHSQQFQMSEARQLIKCVTILQSTVRLILNVLNTICNLKQKTNCCVCLFFLRFSAIVIIVVNFTFQYYIYISH